MRLNNLPFLACATAMAFAADVEYQARLLTPVSSYSPAGTHFSAKIAGTLARGEVSALPPGSTVSGTVTQAKSIGFGLRRERALLDLEFNGCQLPSGDPVTCTSTLSAVTNARETVDPGGRITGILAASHPHSWLGGMWVRPGSVLSGRSAAGLTGTAGRLQSSIAPSPIGAIFAITSRLLLFRMPKAEIELPAGTEVVLRITTDSPLEQASNNALLTEEMDRALARIEPSVSGGGGRPVADIINIVLTGPREQVEHAFAAAGWLPADPLTPRTFARVYAAASAMKAYPTAPVSNLYYDGRVPDLVFQRTFNSAKKRHHIRFWLLETTEGPVWAGAATHDVSVAFDWSRLTINHVIDLNIDRERQVVINDLREAGCIQDVSFVERARLAASEPVGGAAVTDGALAAAAVRECDARTAPTSVAGRKERLTTRVARHLLLEARHYVTRSNPYYWAYRGVRRTVARKRSEPALEASSPAAASVDD